MKKIFLSLGLAAIAFCAQANSLNVINTLSNPVTLRFWGVNLDGTTFNAPPLALVPGSNPFANPTMLPGVAGAQATGRITMAFGVCNPYDLALGSPNIGSVTSTQNVGSLNQCNNNVPFVMTWNEQPLPPYNAVILIL